MNPKAVQRAGPGRARRRPRAFARARRQGPAPVRRLRRPRRGARQEDPHPEVAPRTSWRRRSRPSRSARARSPRSARPSPRPQASAKATITTGRHQAVRVAGVVNDVVSREVKDADAAADVIADATREAVAKTATPAKRTRTTARKGAKATHRPHQGDRHLRPQGRPARPQGDRRPPPTRSAPDLSPPITAASDPGRAGSTATDPSTSGHPAEVVSPGATGSTPHQRLTGPVRTPPCGPAVRIPARHTDRRARPRPRDRLDRRLQGTDGGADRRARRPRRLRRVRPSRHGRRDRARRLRRVAAGRPDRRGLRRARPTSRSRPSAMVRAGLDLPDAELLRWPARATPASASTSRRARDPRAGRADRGGPAEHPGLPDRR